MTEHRASCRCGQLTAIASDDPVIFFEPKRRYHERADVVESATPLPLHAARTLREGKDATLLAYGPMVKTCLSAAEAAAEDGHDLEVIDLRSLAPLDMTAVAQSAQRTAHVVVVHEAPLNLGLGAELGGCGFHIGRSGGARGDRAGLLAHAVDLRDDLGHPGEHGLDPFGSRELRLAVGQREGRPLVERDRQRRRAHLPGVGQAHRVIARKDPLAGG